MVRTAEHLTVTAYDQAITAGLRPDQAWPLVREELVFQPDEEDVRRLPPESARSRLTLPEKIERVSRSRALDRRMSPRRGHNLPGRE